MHIVHITSSFAIGGAEAILYTLVSRLQTEGYQQSIITLRDGPYREIYKRLGISVYFLTTLYGRYTPLPLITVLRQLRPDVVHSILWKANLFTRLVCRILRIPHVIALHNMISYNGRLRTIIDRVVPYTSGTIVAVSPLVATAAQTTFGSALTAPIVVIPNGIAITALPLRTQVRQLSDSVIFGAVGRFVPVKKFDTLLHAFAQVHKAAPQTRLLVLGYGQLENELRTLITVLNITSHVDMIINQPACNYYQMMDYFVQPSASEGISIALLEAMAYGVVPIVTTLDGHHPVVTPYTGYIIHDQTINAVAQTMHAAVIHVNNRIVYATEAQKSIQEQFNAHTMVQSYRSLFEQMTCP